ncbi:MafI family immunity protein [Amycolatopsis sp. NPDC051716]|uniref:MafI family immunity protein n=1 Tax=Amycolatopsis sp. NPDC051716 TaxID=3155804 RepID=UPI00341C89FB
MNSTWYEEIAACMRGLSTRLGGRLSDDQQRQVAEFIDVNEFGLALEALADFLCEDEQPVWPDERSDMLELARRMQIDGRVGRALALCPGVAT